MQIYIDSQVQQWIEEAHDLANKISQYDQELATDEERTEFWEWISRRQELIIKIGKATLIAAMPAPF